MAEPTTTAGGISIAAVLIALLGPLAGQYTVIVLGMDTRQRVTPGRILHAIIR